MSLVLDLIIPGSGSVVGVLATILQLCAEMKEGQNACKRLHLRLKDVFDELAKMESKGELPQSDVLNKYVVIVAKYLSYLERYREKALIFRLVKHRRMVNELLLINEDIDMLFKTLSLASTAAMMEWRQQWENDQRVQQGVMASLVSNTAVIMRELQSPRAQQEAILTLKFETEKQTEQQSNEMMQLMKSAMVTVVRASTTTVEKLPPWFIPSCELDFEPEPFAQGSFGTVHRGVWGSGTKVVVKCFPMDAIAGDERSRYKIEAEMNLWYQFNHPNVIKMFGASHVSSPPFIACEDASNGDLCSFLSRSKDNKRQMWRLLYQAALGLDYIHKKRVVHGDLKLNNILVGADGQAKVSDFGMSIVRTSSSISKTKTEMTKISGGLRWRAPECLTKRPTFASDIYSFAMCIIEAVLDEPPFAFLDDDDVRENLKKGVIPDRPEEIGDEAWELVVLMTNIDPAKRIDIDAVVENMKLLADDEVGVHEENMRCSSCLSAIPEGATFCSACGVPTSADALQVHLNLQDDSLPNGTPECTITDLMANIAKGTEDEREKDLLLLVQKCGANDERAALRLQ